MIVLYRNRILKTEMLRSSGSTHYIYMHPRGACSTNGSCRAKLAFWQRLRPIHSTQRTREVNRDASRAHRAASAHLKHRRTHEGSHNMHAQNRARCALVTIEWRAKCVAGNGQKDASSIAGVACAILCGQPKDERCWGVYATIYRQMAQYMWCRSSWHVVDLIGYNCETWRTYEGCLYEYIYICFQSKVK